MTYSSLLRCLIFTAAAVCASQSATALSPMKATIRLTVPFSAGSAAVPEASVAEIVHQVSCIESISLEVVIVTASGDNMPSQLDGVGQMKLAAERANAIRASFLNLGIPDWRIYAEAHAGVQPPYLRQSNRPEGGVAQVEYTGICRGGAGCQVKCKGQEQ